MDWNAIRGRAAGLLGLAGCLAALPLACVFFMFIFPGIVYLAILGIAATFSFVRLIVPNHPVVTLAATVALLVASLPCLWIMGGIRSFYPLMSVLALLFLSGAVLGAAPDLLALLRGRLPS